MIQTRVDEKAAIEISVEGTPVRLVDFALGGVYVQADKLFPPGDTVNLCVDLGKKGKIDLLGTVVRTSLEPETECWGIAIDLSHFYGFHVTRKG